MAHTLPTHRPSTPSRPDRSNLDTGGNASRKSIGPLAGAGIIYLGLSVLLWWHAWFQGPSSVISAAHFMSRSSGDPAQEVWALAWIPHALAHGLDPFFSRSLYAPAGVNLIANTSILLPSLVLTPVTAIFGPVAAFTVAVTLAPMLSAWAAFIALRRYVTWGAAAFVGGLLYGFGPFVNSQLPFGHLYLTILVIPPLVLISLERILVRQNGSAVRAGAILGVLLICQFFISIEMLVLIIVISTCAVVVLALTHRHEVAVHTRYAVQAVAMAAGLAGAVLAYPTWLYIGGPRHFVGSVFLHSGHFGALIGAGAIPHASYGAYLGLPLVMLLAVAVIVWPGRRVLRLAVMMTLVCYVLSLGSRLKLGKHPTRVPLPGWVLSHLPILSSLLPIRFAALTALFAGLVLAVVLDLVHSRDLGRLRSRPSPANRDPVHDSATSSRAASRDWAGPAVALLLASVVLVPLVLAAPSPYPTRRLREPAVLQSQAFMDLPAGTIVREYPDPSYINADAMIWQAMAHLHYSLVDGYILVPSPVGRAVASRTAGPLALVFAAAALGRLQRPFSVAIVDAVRRSVHHEHLGALVVLPGERGAGTLRALLTAAFGPPNVSARGGLAWTRI
ncbi:MAG: glycosyltransferase family protein [Acidimicrobiales bacterium]